MSPRNTPSSLRNRLLTALPKDDLAWLRPHLQPLPLEKNKTLESANKKIDNIYFPERGFASVVGSSGNKGREVEVGIIGYEGMTGLSVIFGSDRSPLKTFIQGEGDGHRLGADILQKAMTRSATLHALLLKFAQAFMLQTTHTAIANARGTLQERLSRWILMAQDRTQSDNIPLTHEFLSLMLAVRRPGVTEALHEVGQKGLIKHERGAITVIDRKGLIECANGFYGKPEIEYERLLGKR
jgi:CRP-like cAMP-binding protein